MKTEWRLARQTHSKICLPLEQFAEKALLIVEKHLSNLSTGAVSQQVEQQARQLLDTLKWQDLFLTTACASGDSVAWESFRRQYQSAIHATALKVSANSGEAADLSDTLLTDLFLPQGAAKGESKIAQYHGLGSLEGWIKVVIHRMAIDRIRLQRRNVSMEELEVELPSTSSHSRVEEPIEGRDIQRARQMVSRCLITALEQLSPQERLVLNLYYLEGVNLKGIGQCLKAHESTASRLIDRLKTRLQKAVSKQLQEKFKVKRNEVSHLIDLAQGHLEIDLKRILSQ